MHPRCLLSLSPPNGSQMPPRSFPNTSQMSPQLFLLIAPPNLHKMITLNFLFKILHFCSTEIRFESICNQLPVWAALAAPGCSWLLLAAPGCSWLLLAAPGYSWLLMAALGSVRLGSARLGSVRFGSARFGAVRLGSAWSVLIGSARFG